MLIDVEFRSVIPALSEEEYKGLEQSIISEGCRDALITWQGTLIDGHNRYEICTKHRIEYTTIEKQFENREAVREWIILNQFGRRNLSLYDRSILALRLKPIYEQRAKERMLSGKAPNPSQKSAQGKTSEELAKIAGVSHDTIHKVEKIEQSATQETKAQIKCGDISINQAYQEIQNKPHIANNSGNNEWYTPTEYIEAARTVMGSIDLDPASCELANKVVKADKIFTIDDDGLQQEWRGNVWLNPPYAGDLIVKFIDKLAQSKVNQAIVLVNNATETQWFYTLIKTASAIIFPTSRVKYYMANGNTGSPLQGQAVIYIGDKPEAFMRVFGCFGWGALL